MHTEEEVRLWVNEIRGELLQSLRDDAEVPDFLKHDQKFQDVWFSGCWLNNKLRQTGMTEDEKHNIGFAHGQRSLFGDPYKWAVIYMNEVDQQGTVTDKPGKELADEINNEVFCGGIT